MISDFLSLIFPKTCIACDQALNKNEECLCTPCRFKLPKSNYHLDADNPLLRRFWGKIPVSYALSYLKFTKSGAVQNILYKIKYQGYKEGAKKLGIWYGKELRHLELQKQFDYMVPVPMHRRKLKKRGYNQSEYFAEGLSGTMGIPHLPEVLERTSENSSQTLKNRFERWINVKDIYRVKNPDQIPGKHILIVDDVITTGATFEACAKALLENGAREVSIAAIASAQ